MHIDNLVKSHSENLEDVTQEPVYTLKPLAPFPTTHKNTQVQDAGRFVQEQHEGVSKEVSGRGGPHL